MCFMMTLERVELSPHKILQYLTILAHIPNLCITNTHIRIANEKKRNTFILCHAF